MYNYKLITSAFYCCVYCDISSAACCHTRCCMEGPWGLLAACLIHINFCPCTVLLAGNLNFFGIDNSVYKYSTKVCWKWSTFHVRFVPVLMILWQIQMMTWGWG